MLTATTAVEYGRSQPAAWRSRQNACSRGSPVNAIGTHRLTGSVASLPKHSLSATQGWQLPTLPVGVVVQVRVAGLQEVPPHTASSLTVHSTHSPTPVSHTVVPARCA